MPAFLASGNHWGAERFSYESNLWNCRTDQLCESEQRKAGRLSFLRVAAVGGSRTKLEPGFFSLLFVLALLRSGTLSMQIFEFRNNVIGDYSKYIKSFISVADPKIQQEVEQSLATVLLWRDPLVHQSNVSSRRNGRAAC
jgi:hypothetical protein